jgi:hypothetical protein
MSRRPSLTALGSLACLTCFSIAQAQEINPLVRERIAVNTDNNRGATVRVQTSINIFIPGPSGEGDAADQLRDRARRMIYQIAGRECAVLEDVIARTCRLEGINVNLNRQMAAGGLGEGYMVGGNMTMMVTLK